MITMLPMIVTSTATKLPWAFADKNNAPRNAMARANAQLRLLFVSIDRCPGKIRFFPDMTSKVRTGIMNDMMGCQNRTISGNSGNENPRMVPQPGVEPA